MIKLLPFILIPILIVGGLGYFRFVAIKQDLTPAGTQQTQSGSGSIEVPKTLPNQTVDDKVKILQDTISQLVTQVNSLKTQSAQTPANTSTSSLDSRLKDVESSVTDLKARVSALEKTTTSSAPVSSQKQSSLYIPLGSGGGPWANKDWYTVTDYQVNLDPANFPGYSGMYLEVTFRLSESAGTGSVRLYNTTDSSAVSSQLDTTSTNFGLSTTSLFKISSGNKNYALQVKSTEEKNLFIQTARIRVSF